MTNLLATEFNNHNIERLVRVSYEYVVLGVENWEGSSLTLDFKKMKGQTA
jgi:hypothetical protein